MLRDQPRAPLRRYLPTLALLLLFLAAWQAVASLASVDDLLLASPSETWQAFTDDTELLLESAWVTLGEVLLGLALAIALGAGAALAMHLLRPLGEAASPLLVASQAIPIPVLAPLFVLAFDYGIWPKVMIVALICFFPITVNVLIGLRSADPELRKLMRSLGASRTATLRKVELPSALPWFFTGLRVAAAVAIIGAVFGEWAGAEEGLGWLVFLDNTHLETPRLYAGVVILSLMAVALYALVALAERLAMPWRRQGAT